MCHIMSCDYSLGIKELLNQLNFSIFATDQKLWTRERANRPNYGIRSLSRLKGYT
jgi:hypothetical protein